MEFARGDFLFGSGEEEFSFPCSSGDWLVMRVIIPLDLSREVHNGIDEGQLEVTF